MYELLSYLFIYFVKKIYLPPTKHELINLSLLNSWLGRDKKTIRHVLHACA